jgi:putative colanic acid biosysnthesis UDP-glucose lipid carrier transferase
MADNGMPAQAAATVEDAASQFLAASADIATQSAPGDFGGFSTTVERASSSDVESGYAFVKRACDIVLSSVFLLLVASWLFPLIALAIRLDSPGPIFFKQQRVGYRRKPFYCLKFRTMFHNEGATFIQATKGDPRITRVGRFMRRTNLDELPQFLNVLFSEMSVVGPRPHVPDLDQAFAHAIPDYARRNDIRPGITGLAQVSGYRGETRSARQMRQRVRVDLLYMKRMGWALDLKVMVLTIIRLIQGNMDAY